MTTELQSIGLIGGTGDLGSALAVHLSKRHEVLLGSRTLEKAKSAVSDIVSEKSSEYIRRNLRPVENIEAVSKSEILILTVPHEHALEIVQNLSTKFHENQILVSAVAAVARRGEEFVFDPDTSGKSFAQSIKEIVPSSVKVAAAFQTLPANVLYREREISADVPVTADDLETFQKVSSLIAEMQGLRPLYLGSLRLSGDLERLTAFLLNIGKRNGLKSPTVKFPSF